MTDNIWHCNVRIIHHMIVLHKVMTWPLMLEYVNVLSIYDIIQTKPLKHTENGNLNVIKQPLYRSIYDIPIIIVNLTFISCFVYRHTKFSDISIMKGKHEKLSDDDPT